MKNLVSIIDNSVTRDTRVQKEAISLAEAFGCYYNVVGIVDKHDDRKENFISPNVKVTRIKVAPLKKSLVTFLKNLSPFGLISLVSLISFACLLIKYFPRTTLFVSIVLLFIGTLRFYKLLELRKLLFFVPISLSTDLRAIVLNYTRSLQLAYEFMPTLISLKPDILHAHDVPMLVVATNYKKISPQVKIVFDAHELYEHMSDRGIFFQKFYKRYIQKLGKNVDVFLTVNESIKEYYKKEVLSLPEAIVVKNAISGSILNRTEIKSSLLRDKIGVLSNIRILLYHGMFSAPRGLDRIIKATALMNPEWVLVFMGWGTNEEELKSEASKAGLLGSRVFFIPPVKLEELPSWTSGADVGIIPYLNTCLNHYYCTPNKLWEYPVAGLPIIAPDYPELARVIDNYGIGWKIKNMEPESISSLINSITAESIQDKAKNINHYFACEGWEIYKENLTSAYKKLLG